MLDGKEGEDGGYALHMLVGSSKPNGWSRLDPSGLQSVNCRRDPGWQRK